MKRIIGCGALLAGFLATHSAAAQTVVQASPTGADVHLTISREDGTLVRDKRSVTLAAGANTVRFPGVPTFLETEGNTVQPLFEGGVDILEQHFLPEQRATGNPLNLYVGKTVSVQQETRRVTGTLRAIDNGWMLETADGVVLYPNGTWILPPLPGESPIPPSLEWLVNARQAGATNVALHYSVPTISWTVTYHATLSSDGRQLSLRGWLDVHNRSSLTFTNAKLHLARAKLTDNSPLYVYPRAVTLPTGEDKQLHYVTLDSPANIDLTADFSSGAFTTNATLSPTLALRLKNDTTSGLGLPLPPGGLTIWQQEADGALRLLSNKLFSGMEVGEENFLPLTTLNDISVSRVVTTRQLNPRVAEYTINITATSKRKQPATVLVRENLLAGTKITETTLEPEARLTNALRFKVEVPAEGKAEFKYTVQTGN